MRYSLAKLLATAAPAVAAVTTAFVVATWADGAIRVPHTGARAVAARRAAALGPAHALRPADALRPAPPASRPAGALRPAPPASRTVGASAPLVSGGTVGGTKVTFNITGSAPHGVVSAPMPTTQDLTPAQVVTAPASEPRTAPPVSPAPAPARRPTAGRGTNPSHAALPADGTPGGTSVSFTVVGAALSVSVPASADLGTGSPGAAVGPVPLGNVTVTDDRAAAGAVWSVAVSATDFTAHTNSGLARIRAYLAVYSPGRLTVTHGGAILRERNVRLFNSPQTVIAAIGANGDNSVTFDPRVQIMVPPGAPDASYSGVITHSVS